jgi:hypothetical protein
MVDNNEVYDFFSRGRKTSKITEEFPDKTKFPLYYEAVRQEFTINEGEMLFIPTGWWHFVFSEETNPETQINYSVNFWYIQRPGLVEGKSFENYVPYVKAHTLTMNELSIKKNSTVKVCKSDTRYFVPNSFHCFYNNNQEEAAMTYETFLSKNEHNVYVIQNICSDIEKYAPKMDVNVQYASRWINFGNVYTLLHYDLHDNWLCQMQGRKRVILFPPEEREKLYPFNPYSIDFINTVMKDVSDEFIIHRIKVFTLEFCRCMSQTPLLEYTTSDLFFHSYNVLNEYLKDYLKERKRILPTVSTPKKFKIIDARCSEYNANDFTFGPYTILWFMTNGIIYVKEYEKILREGECLLFPTSFLYTWKVQGAVFVMPE